ncbi:type II toxin-antitoxin system RatA family toxin [Wolbachia endosymbiont of Pentidionis agamae]|uniref:type II toxin-antitoxin system RatA family toxin n=1 Tax=Wolbachia endosymbiont of Pentidionis agamae TaxID=3110435 RepID=UPI002FD78ECB
MFHRVFNKQDFISCAAYEIFQVVIDVESYPEFIPWCKAIYVEKKCESFMVVDLLAKFYGLEDQYTSLINFSSPTQEKNGWIKIVSSNGVFKHMYNKWEFISLDKNSTVVKFYIEFEFHSRLFYVMFNSVFKYVEKKIITAFKNRARELKLS